MTTPIIPDFIFQLFENEVQEIVFKVLKNICKEYDLDYEEVKKFATIKLYTKLNNIHISKKIDPKHPDDIKCQARMIREMGIKQCCRKKSEGDFCKIHHKCEVNNTLKYGRITDPISKEMQDIINKKHKNKIY
jgi:hypothetical protein